jgi:hypothetical protein
MLLAACKDARMNKTLDLLLSAPAERRRAIVTTLLDRLRERDAPEALIAAIACFLDDEAAEKALEVIRQYTKSENSAG